MRLMTHNMLTCNVKACTATANRCPEQGPLNFPLRIVPADSDSLEVVETNFSKDFVVHMMSAIDWKALCKTVKELNRSDVPLLPDELPPNFAHDEAFLKTVHRIVLDTNVYAGELVCNNCARSYPIDNGIPNMLLDDDEI